MGRDQAPGTRRPIATLLHLRPHAHCEVRCRSSALARIDPVLCAKNDPPRPREERQATPRFAARQTRSRGRRRQPGRSNRFPHAGSRPWKVRALRASARMMGIHPARLSGVDDIAGHPPCTASNRVLGVGQSNRAQMGNSCRAPKPAGECASKPRPMSSA